MHGKKVEERERGGLASHLGLQCCCDERAAKRHRINQELSPRQAKHWPRQQMKIEKRQLREFSHILSLYCDLFLSSMKPKKARGDVWSFFFFHPPKISFKRRRNFSTKLYPHSMNSSLPCQL